MTYTVSFENKSLLWPEGDWRIVAVSQEHKSDTSTPFPHPSHPGLCSILAGARRCRDARSEILQYRMKILRCGTSTQNKITSSGISLINGKISLNCPD